MIKINFLFKILIHQAVFYTVAVFLLFKWYEKYFYNKSLILDWITRPDLRFCIKYLVLLPLQLHEMIA